MANIGANGLRLAFDSPLLRVTRATARAATEGGTSSTGPIGRTPSFTPGGAGLGVSLLAKSGLQGSPAAKGVVPDVHTAVRVMRESELALLERYRLRANQPVPGRSDAQQQALREYAGFRFTVNNRLRAGVLSASERDLVQLLDDATDGQRIGEITRLYRQVPSAPSLREALGGMRKGDVLKDAGFMSTSLDRGRVAASVTAGKSSHVVYILDAPPGTRGAILHGTSAEESFGGEAEILLGRNIPLRLTADPRTLPNGTLVIRATVGTAAADIVR